MNKKVFFLLLFLTAIGMTTGCFFELLLSGSGKEELMSLLGSFLGSNKGSSAPAEHIFSKIAAGAAFVLPAFLLPLLPWLMPFHLIYLFGRGFFLGFSSAMVLETFGARGLFYIAVTLIPAQLLQFLLFAFLLCCSLQEYQHLRHRKKSIRKAPQIFAAGPYLYTYAAGLGILILICLFQSALLQAVTGP